VEHHGDRTVTIVLRPDGVRILSTTDRHGHLIRRVRRDPHGRDFVIFDDSAFAPHRRDDVFVHVRPPRVHDRRRYIVDARRADRRRLYRLFTAPPIAPLPGYYTVDQVRYSHPLREYMPRVDLDIHFDSGSWQLTPDQIDRLGEIAYALNEAIESNPRELFLIEGHTDAVGSAEDNLSLSDRRAEAVAVALTEVFQVPPENLVTQGYGEEYPRVPTLGPSRANRRVAVRRITPLIARR
ncbi:MAG: OmpA family protein, partial [Pseudolabrys sp.]